MITINERQHIKNALVCSFCEDESKKVVGRAYMQDEHNYPNKRYLFSYCEECIKKQIKLLEGLVDLR